jgi:hypothetical protein
MAKASKAKKPAKVEPADHSPVGTKAPAGYNHASGAPAPVKGVPAGY